MLTIDLLSKHSADVAERLSQDFTDPAVDWHRNG